MYILSLSRVIRAVLLLALSLSVGCSREPEARSKMPPGKIVLTGAGATFSSILYNHWIVAYHNRNPKVIIEYSPVGSGEGVVVLSERTSQKKNRSISVLVIPPCRTRNWSVL